MRRLLIVGTAIAIAIGGLAVVQASDEADAQTAGVTTDLVVSHFEAHDPMLAGDVQTYTLEVINNGPDAATGFTAFLQLRSDASSITATSPCTKTAGRTVRCQQTTSLAVGAKKSFTITGRPGRAGGGSSVTNSVANVTGPDYDPVPFNNTDEEDTQVTPGADVRAGLSGPTSLDLTEIGDYVVTVSDAGPDDAAGAVTEISAPGAKLYYIPAGCSYETGFLPPVRCTVGTMDSGAKVTKLIRLYFENPGTYRISVQNSATSPADPLGTNNSASLTVVVSEDI